MKEILLTSSVLILALLLLRLLFRKTISRQVQYAPVSYTHLTLPTT